MSFRLGVALGCSGFSIALFVAGSISLFSSAAFAGGLSKLLSSAESWGFTSGTLYLGSFEAFCAFFTAGCETPKWIAVANSPFYLEFLRIRVLALAMIRRIHQHKIRAGHIYRCFGNQ